MNSRIARKPARQRRAPPPDPHVDLQQRSLFVGDLDENVSKHELYEIFSKYGTVDEIKLPLNKKGKCLGHAYINYKFVKDAQSALSNLRHPIINSKQCRVMPWAKPDKSNYNICVKHLPSSVTNAQLYDMFSPYGTISSSKVQANPKTNQSLGYGYVAFESEQQANDAINKTNGMMVKGHRIATEMFISRQQRYERLDKLDFTNVYVKHIPPSWSETDVIQFFEQETNGRISSHHFSHKGYGMSACLNFVSVPQAKRCIARLNGYAVDSYTLYVARAQKRKERDYCIKRQKKERWRAQSKLFVANLPPYVEEDELRNMFMRYGSITSCFIERDDEGAPLNRGVVGFRYKHNASNAMDQLNGTFYGRFKLDVTRFNGNKNKHLHVQNKHVECDEKAIVSVINQRNEKQHSVEVVYSVEVWLKRIVKLPQYIQLFKDEGVDDFETLQLLDEDAFKQIGIKKIGHLKKIISYGARLNTNDKDNGWELQMEGAANRRSKLL
eukprot:689810_1